MTPFTGNPFIDAPLAGICAAAAFYIIMAACGFPKTLDKQDTEL